MTEERAIELAKAHQRTLGPERKILRVTRTSRESCEAMGFIWPSWSVLFEATPSSSLDVILIEVQGDGTATRMMTL